MKKLYCKRKYSISLIIVFSLLTQLFVPFFSIDANADRGSGFSSESPIYNESTGEFEIRFQYDLEKVQPGAEFTVDIDPDYVDLQELQDTVNYTIQRSGNSYKIKFNDEFSGLDQGILSIKTKVKEVDKSDYYEIKWKLDGEEESEIIFIKKPGDSESDIKGEKSSKNVQSYIWDLGNKIKGEVNEDGEQSITVEKDITSVNIPYTLVYETETGGTLNIKDELDDLLTYTEGSFTAKLETWDSNGWNKETTDNVDLSDYLKFDGNTFSIEGYELPPNSRITINYNANVKDAKTLETYLNQLLEDQQLDGKEGSVSYGFNNKAKFNDDEDRDGKYSGNVNVPGEKEPEEPKEPQYPQNVLEKSVDPTTANATFDNEGNLIAIPVTYTLKLNMSKFNGDNIKQLTDNLILTDNLDSNHKVEFELSDVEIISDGGVTVKEGYVDETDDTIGHYSFTNNKEFKFNAGKEPADYTITLKGNITALNDQKDYWGPLPFFDYYSYKNTAVAEAGKDLIGRGEATTTVIDKKGQTTITDSNVFHKGHKTNPTTPVIGEPIEITYTFTVNDWNAGANAVDVSKSTITDVLDPIFDTSKGYEITLSDNWNGQSLDYITHSLKDGELTIDFADNMPENIKKARWVINITLTTFPITEQSQAKIRNSASLTGSDSGLDYSSSTETSGQTTGGELLVRKTVTDLDKIDYVKNYTLELDSDGNPKHTEFNYKIDLIPQVDFRNVKILPLTDVLPDALEFVGLIGSGESDTATVNRTTEDYGNTGGKVEVTYDNGELKIANNNSTFGSGSISIRFRVKLKDDYKLKAGDTISNVITETDPPANITIVEPGKYPINITKVDSETGKRIEDEKQVARFKLEKVEEDGTKTTVYNDIRIDSGQLVDAEGKALVVESIGNYQLTETKAPTGYVLSEEPIDIKVTENGTIPGQIVVKNTPDEDPEPETTTHTVVKKWEVEEGVETPAVEVTLYNGENKADVTDATVELNSTNGYTYTWEDLPADGVYTVVETESEEYEQVSNTISEDGLTTTITNKLVEPEPEKTEVTVDKVWVGGPEEKPVIQVQLYRNGVAYLDPVTLDGVTSYTWTGLDATDENGVEYVYTVDEVEVPENYEKTVDGLKITNTYVSPKTEITGTKVWVDGPKEKPSIELQLFRNGEAFGEPITLEDGETSYTWTDLDKTDENGVDYIYTVDEVAVPENYEKTISEDGLTVTNKYIEPEDPDPVDPTDPENPDPVDPTDPENPDPVDPTDPENPDPEKPEDPKNENLPNTGTTTYFLAPIGISLILIGLWTLFTKRNIKENI